MTTWLEFATAVLVSSAVFVIWDFAVIAALRVGGVKLSFLLPFHVSERRGRELSATVPGRNTYVFISGILLFACPLFVALTFYDYVVRTFIEHSAYTLAYVVGSAVLFVLMIIVGIWSSLSQWNKRPDGATK